MFYVTINSAYNAFIKHFFSIICAWLNNALFHSVRFICILNISNNFIWATNCNCHISLFFSTRWHSNPFILGAYSYISTECDNNRIILDKLLSRELKYHDFYSEGNSQNDGKHKSSSDSSNKNKNSVEPVILFAGEACHEKYFSTAHGAFLSGVEQAQKINNFFKQSL